MTGYILSEILTAERNGIEDKIFLMFIFSAVTRMFIFSKCNKHVQNSYRTGNNLSIQQSQLTLLLNDRLIRKYRLIR